MNIALRSAEIYDEDFLYKVFASTRQDEMALVDWTEPQKEAFLHMQFEAQRRSYLLQFPNAQNQVIICDSAPAGRLITNSTDREIHIIDIALLPAQRNKGIGRTLLQELQAEAAQAEKRITLHVEFFNPAQHLYERLGFVGVGQSGLYYEMEWRPAAVVPEFSSSPSHQMDKSNARAA